MNVQLRKKDEQLLRPFVPPVQPVLLITPPSCFLLDERVFVSLGILKIAAVLEAAGCKVEHLDLSGVENYEQVVEDHLLASAVEIVGVTMTTPQLPAAARVVAAVRRAKPSARIVAGGPHITLVCAAVKLEHKRELVGGRAQRALTRLEQLFDVLVAGDGELAVLQAISSDPPKIVDGDDHRGPLFMTDAFYDASPYPARHLVDVASYKYEIEGHRSCSLIAQLGCPYKCNFCGGRNSKALRMIRTRTTESIVHEVEMLHRTHGFTGFMFYDDELNVNKGLVSLMDALSDLQARLGTEFRLRGFVKSELLTDEQAAAMRRAGFRWLLCGFEAGHPRILENIQKQATVEDNTRVMEIAARHDLKVKALMSVGHAGESEETILAVRDWLLVVRPADFDCTVITTYPGTPYYDEALETSSGVWTYTCKKSGDRLHAREVDFSEGAQYYKGDPDGGYVSYVYTDHLSGEQIVKLRDQVEREVREQLGIPFNQARAALRYEHSMGQGANLALPPHILRRTQ